VDSFRIMLYIVWITLMRYILFYVYLDWFIQLSKVKFIPKVDEYIIVKP